MEPQEQTCTNCSTPLEEIDRFCPRCGQKHHDNPLDSTILLKELSEEVFSLDSKILKSVHYLLLKPGRMTIDFIKGKRASFVSPLRLYINISLIYFLVLSFGKPELKFNSDHSHSLKNKGYSFNLTPFHVKDSTVSSDTSQSSISSKTDTLVIGFSPEIDNSWFEEKLLSLQSKFKNIETEKFWDKFSTYLSIMFFVLLPFLALLLKWFFYKNKILYLGHLVFSLHLHSFAFLLFTGELFCNRIPFSQYLIPFITILLLVYTALSMKRVYNQTMGWVILKLTVMIFIYFMLLGFSFLTTFLIAVWLF